MALSFRLRLSEAKKKQEDAICPCNPPCLLLLSAISIAHISLASSANLTCRVDCTDAMLQLQRRDAAIAASRLCNQLGIVSLPEQLRI